MIADESGGGPAFLRVTNPTDEDRGRRVNTQLIREFWSPTRYEDGNEISYHSIRSVILALCAEVDRLREKETDKC